MSGSSVSNSQRMAGAYHTLVNALAVMAAVIVGVAVVLIVVDVTIRTLDLPPPHYTIALVEYGLLYVTMGAAPYLVRERGHVYIDALISRLPPRVEWLCAKLAYLIGIVAALTFSWLALELFVEAVQSGFVDERGIDMPYWSLYLPITVGCALVAVELARYLFGSRLMHRAKSDVDGSV